MKVYTTIQSHSSWLFYFALAFFLIRHIASETTLYDLAYVYASLRILGLASYGLLVLKMCFQRYSKTSLCKILIVSLIILVSSTLAESKDLVYGLLFILAAQDIDFKTVTKEVLAICLSMTLLVVVLAQLGFIASNTQIISSSWNTIQLWGFTHHNYVGNKALLVAMSFLFLRYDHFKIYDIIPLILLFCFCYFVVESRTSALLILLGLVLIGMYKGLSFVKEKKSVNLIPFVTYGIMAFSVLLSIYVCVYYDEANSVFAWLNTLLSGRLYSAHCLYLQYGFSFFGQYVLLVSTNAAKELGTNSIILDNAYMHLGIHYGLFAMVAILLGYFDCARKAMREKNYGIVILVCLCFICGISEQWLFIFGSNPFLLLLAPSLHSQENEKQKEPLMFLLEFRK